MGYTLAVLGCGTMGIAISSGILASLETRRSQGSASKSSDEASSGISTPTASFAMTAPEKSLPSRFITTVGRQETVKRLRKTYDSMGGMASEQEVVEVVHGEEGNLKAVKEADVILVCSKPNLARQILEAPGVAKELEGKIVISICAGVTLAQLKSWVPENTTVIRAMPNTASKIREGMTVISTLPPSAHLHREIVLGIFSSCGRCRFLDEKHFDACTAVAGSGPAFMALVLEAMVDGGVMMGLPRVEAVELAAQTMQGTGRMVLNGQHPAQLKDSVTTPGGCTIAGLLTLEDGRVRSTIARAVQTATMHAAGLGQDSKK